MTKVQPFCSLCGQSMPFSQLPLHRKKAHSDVSEIIATARREYLKRHQEVFLPLFIGWGLLLVLGFNAGVLRGWPFIPFMVAGGAILIVLPYLSTRPATRAGRRALSGIAVLCVFCGVSLMFGTLPEHEKSHHPEAYRYGRLWRRVPYGLVLGYVAILLLVWLSFTLGHLSAEVSVLIILVSPVSVIAAAVWFRSAITRRVVALRDEEWGASHDRVSVGGLTRPPAP